MREEIESVRKGYPVDRLDQMAHILAVDRSVFLAVMGISERTFHRKAQVSGRLSAATSDRLARLDRIIHLATDVLGTKDKAVEWLKRPSRALGAEMPFQLLDTDAGTQRVEHELRQIQFGFVY